MEILPAYPQISCIEVCVTELKVYMLFLHFSQYTAPLCSPCEEQRISFLIVNTLFPCSIVFGIKLLRACVCAHSPVLGHTALGLLTPLPNARAANN